ncbi:pantetheine-phosphate adenylyltransferase [Fusobacterium sp. PH5-44]|uniref:pantetheine-phosphate adenylyltransferase n=1 Tax=unclassified Fusobacterium TaxID=2648384 RepID=UPI003D1BD827
MKVAVYSGSFDPITKGHQDIIRKSLEIVDKIIVVVVGNVNKKYWFDLEERKQMIETVMTDLSDRIEVKSCNGLLVDFMAMNNINIIIRGLRAVSDYEYELAYAFNNNDLSYGKVQTIFLPASREYMYHSSSAVREAATAGAELSFFADSRLIDIIKKRAEGLSLNNKL